MSPANQDITVFAETNFRNQRRKFGIKIDDRRRHMYLVGKTGMGKSTVLENMIINDIRSGHGVAVVDPHGDLAEKILKFIPNNRVNDVIYFNPADMSYPVAFNILENVGEDYKHLVAYGLVGVFKKIWADSWGPRMEYILTNTILALLDYPGSTLLGVMRILVDKSFRKKVVSKLTDPVVKTFWTDEYANYTEKFRSEAIAPIQNKVGQFLASSIIRNIVGQSKSTIEMREIMDNQKILIMNLSKGRIGEENSALLGAMMITKLQIGAMSRVDIPENDRKDFYLYVDEFQNFATDSFASILSEARKYRLCLIIAHQYLEQLGEVVKPAVFGNVGTMIVFRMGGADALELEPEFTPQFLAQDLVNLKKYTFCLRLMIDGVATEPFSAMGLPPVSGETDNIDKVIKVSRERYARPRSVVEEKILRWSGVEVHPGEGKTDGGSDDETMMGDDDFDDLAGAPSAGDKTKSGATRIMAEHDQVTSEPVGTTTSISLTAAEEFPTVSLERLAGIIETAPPVEPLPASGGVVASTPIVAVPTTPVKVVLETDAAVDEALTAPLPVLQSQSASTTDEPIQQTVAVPHPLHPQISPRPKINFVKLPEVDQSSTPPQKSAVTQPMPLPAKPVPPANIPPAASVLPLKPTPPAQPTIAKVSSTPVIKAQPSQPVVRPAVPVNPTPINQPIMGQPKPLAQPQSQRPQTPNTNEVSLADLKAGAVSAVKFNGGNNRSNEPTRTPVSGPTNRADQLAAANGQLPGNGEGGNNRRRKRKRRSGSGGGASTGIGNNSSGRPFNPSSDRPVPASTQHSPQPSAQPTVTPAVVRAQPPQPTSSSAVKPSPTQVTSPVPTVPPKPQPPRPTTQPSPKQPPDPTRVSLDNLW